MPKEKELLGRKNIIQNLYNFSSWHSMTGTKSQGQRMRTKNQENKQRYILTIYADTKSDPKQYVQEKR